ncbi:MAG: urea ABC transporter substrate-binding protein [Verrucomicrobia bacterium]|nr:urea ABC transporter substrate-binding protein [Verrucomicrobiota bacterium]
MRTNTPCVIALTSALCALAACQPAPREPVKAGVLHSLTGTMAISERSVIDATLLAIEEINERGGVLGRPIQPVVVDGKSDWPAFAAEAERLITEEKASVVFGCWTSASRKTVKPVFERHNHLLFYPVQYEGLEQSPNIVYTGAAPNQQIIPAVEWCFRELKAKKFFLIGSDYVFPRTAHAIIKAQVGKLGGEIVGDEHVLLGSMEFKAVVTKIAAARPHVILNCVNGDSNIGFFDELRAAGITPATLPTVSFSLAEDELRSMGAQRMAGDYCAWNYFQSVDTRENLEFVAKFRGRYGRNRVTDDPMEAAYSGVHLWAQAVRRAGSADPAAVRKALAGLTFAAPGGPITVDPATQHIFKTVRIGRIRPDGQFDIVWASPAPVRPEPYPPFKSKGEWEKFLADLFNGWGRRWANPGK